MDEIREILRKERPDKYKLAALQLQGLCDDCKKIGINATCNISGNLWDTPPKYLEIILDNAFEAVSNALKYAHCSKIEIKIVVLNQMVRCSISDNGVGCEEIIDGMGLSGMRNRMRSVNGVLDFTSEFGFVINMLFPLEHERG
jgi:signal transduction histidine kinase